MDPSGTNLQKDQALPEETVDLDETGLQTQILQARRADRLEAAEIRSLYVNSK